MAISSTGELNRAVIKALGLEGKMVFDVTMHFQAEGVRAVITLGISNELAAEIGAELQRVDQEEKRLRST